MSKNYACYECERPSYLKNLVKIEDRGVVKYVCKDCAVKMGFGTWKTVTEQYVFGLKESHKVYVPKR